MKRLFAVFIGLALTLGFAREMPILYNSSVNAPLDSKPESIVQNLIAKQAGKVQPKACGDKPVGTGGQGDFFFKLSGSFLKAKADQAVYFVSGCSSPGKQALYMSLFENQKLINLYQITVPGRFVEAYSVNDVNLNGQREIAFIYDWQDSCDGTCTFRTLDLLEFKNNEPSVNTSLIVERGGDVSAAYRFIYTVYVLKGKTPVFVGMRSTGTTTLTALENSPSLTSITKLK
jgi:hypothetical protein